MSESYEHTWELQPHAETYLRFALADVPDHVLAELWWWMDMRRAEAPYPPEPPKWERIRVPTINEIIERLKSDERSWWRQADFMLARLAAALVGTDPEESDFALSREVGFRHLEPVPPWFGETPLTGFVRDWGSTKHLEYVAENFGPPDPLPGEIALDNLPPLDLIDDEDER